MTFSERNVFFRIGIVFCAALAFFVFALSFYVMPAYPAIEENTRRPADLFQMFFGLFMETDYYAVHFSIIVSALFSIAGIIFIFTFFRQTSAPEIFYMAIFTISLSFEIIRFILPLYLIYNIPPFYLVMAWRILFFIRYFSIFSLFAASICTAGLEIQKTYRVVVMVFIAALIVAFSAPIDTQNWDTSLNMVNGFSSMFNMIEVITFLVIVISFFVAANVRGSKDYNYAGIGIMLALTGRKLLLYADNWGSLVPGIFLLFFGTWYTCAKLHKIHLWL